MNATDVITEISYRDPGLDSPVLWMAAGAGLAGVIVFLVGVAGAVVSRWWRRGQEQDTAGTAGWDLLDS